MSNSTPKHFSGNTGLFITGFGRTVKSGTDCDFVRGGFERDPEVQFELLMDDTSNELCFTGTRMREFRITTANGTALFLWPGTFRQLADTERLWLLIGDLVRSLDAVVTERATEDRDYVVARVQSFIRQLLERGIRKSLIVSAMYQVLVGMVSGDSETPKVGY